MINNLKVNVDEIKDVCKKHETNIDSVWKQALGRFNLTAAQRAGNRQKRSGVSVATLFETAIAVRILMVTTIQGFFSSQYNRIVQCSKWAFYRFSQDPRFNWRNVLYQFNQQIEQNEELDEGEKPRRPTALILDDSTLTKVGKCIEGVSCVHDHVINGFVIGFKLLGLLWFNGYYGRFLDFSLVAEKKLKTKRRKKQFWKKRRKNSPGAVRKSELRKDKISLSCELIACAVKHGFIPDFILTDTWFTCAKVINFVRSFLDENIHFLGMIKDGTRKYIYNGKEYTLGQLRKHVMQLQHRCRRFHSRYIIVDCVIPNVGKVRLIFSRFHGQKKWVALVTTKTDMSYIEAIETYAIRWNIEIGFKETKSLLGLGKCQANDFDSQIAHITSVFIAHAILANYKYHQDYQSLGALFAEVQSQYTELLAVDKLLLLFEDLLRTIADQIGDTDTVTLSQLFESPEYAMFRAMLGESLILYATNGTNQSLPDKHLNERWAA